MKVIHLTTVHPRYDTRIFLKECCSLVKNGFSVSLIVGDGLGNENINNIEIVDIGRSSQNRLKRILKQSFLAFRMINRMKPDILHFHDPELIPLCFYLSFKKIRIVFDVHENVAKDILTKSWIKPGFRAITSFLYKFLENLLITHFSLVLAETSYLKDYSKVKQKIILQNLPLLEMVNNTNYTLHKYNDPTIGYIGVVSKERGIIKTVKACMIIRDEGIMIQIKCIGPVTEDVLNSTEFKNAQESGWLEMFGYMPARDAWPIISKCHLGVAILDPEENFIESYPTKMFEYMALSIPVIVSNFPLYDEIIKETRCGVTVEPSDLNSQIEAIKQILSDKKKSYLMGRNGMNAILKKYNWSLEVKQLFTLYSKLD